MASDSQRIITLEEQVRKLLATVPSFQGQPSNATFSVPHNDSFPFEDNVDATHAANLRYIISANVTRVVTAKLSIFMAPYRTYNSFSATATGFSSANHSHGSAAHSHGHAHTVPIAGNAAGQPVDIAGANGSPFTSLSGPITSAAINTDATSTTPGSTGLMSTDHTHSLSLAGALGVTEGATATGVTIAFDGVLSSLGPFNADVIELDVRSLIGVTTGVKHTIAMQPSGNGRIEAFLRLGCYVSAGGPG
jgi:hypothetical protein